MLFGKREPRSLGARRRGGYRPAGESLEDRKLLAVNVIDLGGVAPGTGTDTSPTRSTPLPAITGDSLSPSPTQAYGVAMANTLSGQSAGYTVTDVGDINNDGYDDFVIGAPSVATAGGATGPNQATAYLVFGSATATAGTISDWLKINSNFGNTGVGRVGNLVQLGNSTANQQDPYNGLGVDSNNIQLSYPFAGIKFVTSKTSGSELGESAAPVIGVSGQNGFLLGAPGPHDPATSSLTNGAGRAFLISGGASLNALIGQTVDLDSLSSSSLSGVNITTFIDSATNATGARVGQSVAYLGQSLASFGSFFADGFNSFAIGAPDASINGTQSGAVFVVDGAALSAGINTIDLSTIGQGTVTSANSGVVFVGNNAGDQAGWSVAGPGDVDGSLTGSGGLITDVLIGAPAIANGAPGYAYLVYGNTLSNFNTQQTTLSSGAKVLLLSHVNNPNRVTPPDTINNIRGLAITGSTGGNELGWAVAGAGDFNSDGLPDILIGSPQFSSSGSLSLNGRVDVFYGAQQVNGTTTLQGTLTIGATTTIAYGSLLGADAGDLAGYALSAVGKMNGLTTAGNPIMVGAPGYRSNVGTVYVIPPSILTLTGGFTLGADSLGGAQLLFTTPGTTNPPFFGASVSGKILPTGTSQGRTADGDVIGDMIIGAPFYQPLTTGTTRAGGGIIVEGAFLTLGTPASITATLGGIDTFGNFTNINTTTPTTMQLYIESNKAQNFDPVTQIDPTSVTVNGVAYPNATITKDPVDENNDGIEDAIITITPRSNIGLTSSTTKLTVSGKTLPSGVNANEIWAAAANITVSGGGGGGGGGGAAAGAIPIGLIRKTSFVAPFGPDRYTPTLQALSGLSSYKAIPYRVAVTQYLPQPGFADRLVRYYYPKKEHRQAVSPNEYTGRRTSTLGSKVFTRGKWHAGDVKKFTHVVPIVPINLQTERLTTPSSNTHLGKKKK